MPNKNSQIVVTKRFTSFLDNNCSYHEKERLLHELSLIAHGDSIDYSEIQNDLFNNLCKKYNLGSPKRYKAKYIAYNRGGVRVAFAFDKNDDMVIIKIDYRDTDFYGDGR